MAAAYSSRKDLVTGGALATLLCFLEHSKPCPSQRPAEVTASERVLKKSAIALSRYNKTHLWFLIGWFLINKTIILNQQYLR